MSFTVQWWLHCLPYITFHCWCTDGYIVCLFPDVSFPIGAMMAQFYASSLVSFPVGALMNSLFASSLVCLSLFVQRWLHFLPHVSFPVGALMAPLLAISLMFLFLLVH